MHRDQSATPPRTPATDERVMTMMLRETLMGLARVRREVTDLRRQYKDLLQQLPEGYSAQRSYGSDALTVDAGRTRLDAAFDDMLSGLATDVRDDPWPVTRPAIDWDEWERTTKARIRAASSIRVVSTGPVSSATGSA